MSRSTRSSAAKLVAPRRSAFATFAAATPSHRRCRRTCGSGIVPALRLRGGGEMTFFGCPSTTATTGASSAASRSRSRSRSTSLPARIRGAPHRLAQRRRDGEARLRHGRRAQALGRRHGAHLPRRLPGDRSPASMCPRAACAISQRRADRRDRRSGVRARVLRDLVRPASFARRFPQDAAGRRAVTAAARRRPRSRPRSRRRVVRLRIARTAARDGGAAALRASAQVLRRSSRRAADRARRAAAGVAPRRRRHRSRPRRMERSRGVAQAADRIRDAVARPRHRGAVRADRRWRSAAPCVARGGAGSSLLRIQSRHDQSRRMGCRTVDGPGRAHARHRRARRPGARRRRARKSRSRMARRRGRRRGRTATLRCGVRRPALAIRLYHAGARARRRARARCSPHRCLDE